MTEAEAYANGKLSPKQQVYGTNVVDVASDASSNIDIEEDDDEGVDIDGDSIDIEGQHEMPGAGGR